MSHNITLTGVKFNDMNLLNSCVQQLSNGQATLDLQAKSFRTFVGQPTNCDAAIKMPGRHDIGLKKLESGGYMPVFDPYDMDRIFACPQSGAPIGRLTQEYTLQQCEYEAAQNGMATERVPGKNGVVTLEVIDNS